MWLTFCAPSVGSKIFIDVKHILLFNHKLKFKAIDFIGTFTVQDNLLNLMCDTFNIT